MNAVPTPTLFGSDARPAAAGDVRSPPAGPIAGSLLDLMYDGFYMVFLLKNRHQPTDADAFRERIRAFLAELERSSLKLQVAADDLHEAKFAFCALVDEIVLGSVPRLRDTWERLPLQLQFFGEQLAGEQFFARLEELRREGARRLPAIEVFHMCLLLGFQGRYLLEGSEKLGYLTSRLGDEIDHLRGRKAAFAPHWASPERIAHVLRNRLPIWVVASVFALCALLGYAALRWTLERQTDQALAVHRDVIQLPPRAASIVITLP